MKRDFQKLVDHGGESKDIGEMGLEVVEVTFSLWHSFRGGGLSRSQLQSEIALVRQTLREWLERGCVCSDSKTAAFCENVLALEPAMWTFVRKECVEPTNNHMVASGFDFRAQRSWTSAHGRARHRTRSAFASARCISTSSVILK